ncbi:MAG: PrsW family intramembrane metalloprotease [Bacteroidetes bacterium]|nr:PrsW family intramembrane metalloprotease [Bacteroidota bacterium]
MFWFIFTNPVVLLFWAGALVVLNHRAKKSKSSFYNKKPYYLILACIVVVFLINAGAMYWATVKNSSHTVRNDIHYFESFGSDSLRLKAMVVKVDTQAFNMDIEMLRAKTTTNLVVRHGARWKDYKSQHQQYLKRWIKNGNKAIATDAATVLAYYETLIGNFEEAKKQLLLAKNKASEGYYFHLASINSLLNAHPDTLIANYWQEIVIKGKVKAAVDSIVSLLDTNSHEIDQVLKHKTVQRWYSGSMVRMHWWNKGHFWEYILSVYRSSSVGLNISNVLVSAFITALFIVYLLSVDLYQREQLRHILFCLGTGILVVPLTFLLRDFIQFELPFFYTGNTNSLAYWVINVGLTEELIKSIPLLIAVYLIRVTNEPIDYIIYAGLGALGFAFLENTLYFKSYNEAIFMQRAAYATVGHLADAMLVGYAFALKYHKYIKGWAIWYYLVGLACAAIVHGLYDYFITISGSNSAFILLFFFVLIAGMGIISGCVNNGINNSSFYDSRKLLQSNWIIARIVAGFTILYILQVVFLSIQKGVEYAVDDFILTSTSALIFLVMSIALYLGSMDIFAGKWRPLYKYFFNVTKRIPRHKNLHKKIRKGSADMANLEFNSLFFKGELVERLPIDNLEKYYKLNCTPFIYDQVEYHWVAFRPHDKHQMLERGEPVNGIIGIPNKLPENSNQPLVKEHFTFKGPYNFDCLIDL